MAFEQLKAKLEAEGLFRPEHKKPLPQYPHKIGIITSSAGAAVHDMIRIISKRYPLSQIYVLPVRVQGEQAPEEIANAIRYANEWNVADVLITGRGGGSMEDLWAFNDEGVARAIFASHIPIISAVGHEPDVTIADFVADVRASTPSNGGELVAPDQMELKKRLQACQMTLLVALETRMKFSRNRLNELANRRVLQSPLYYVQDKRLALDYTHEKLCALSQQLLEKKHRQFIRLTASLDAMSPLKVLSRGYAVAKHKGVLVTSVKQIKQGDAITLTVADGVIETQAMDGKEKIQ